jgi:hypothetical protein
MKTLLISTDIFEGLLSVCGKDFSSLITGFAEDSLRYHGGFFEAGGAGGLILAEGSFVGSGSGIVASDRFR